jgi:hypothetical protein
MSTNASNKRIGQKIVVYGIPACIFIYSAIFTLSTITQQVLICIILVWFQISLMLGLLWN